MLTLFQLLARLPLRLLHILGAAGGWLTYLASPRYRKRLNDNFALAALGADPADSDRLLGAAIAGPGKTALETPAIWFRSPATIKQWVTKVEGWDLVEAALARGKGILFLTPHLGCFEITAQYYALHAPITVLYRPPRKQVLEPLMVAGRSRANLYPAPANVKGVRSLLKALKRGEAVGMLPDQVPRAGEGAWAEFFGRPAYTMTLASRLVKGTGAQVILAFAERLPRGEGYFLHLEAGPADNIVEGGAESVSLPASQSGSQPISFETSMNQALERLIRRCPAQYLWGYDRYKRPKGEARERGAAAP